MHDFIRELLKWSQRAYIVFLIAITVALIFIELASPTTELVKWAQENSDSLLLAFMVLLSTGGLLILGGVARVENILETDLFHRLHQRIARLRSQPEQMIIPELNAAVMRLEIFFETGVFTLYGMRQFQDFWFNAIHTHPGSNILATSFAFNDIFLECERSPYRHARECRRRRVITPPVFSSIMKARQ